MGAHGSLFSGKYVHVARGYAIEEAQYQNTSPMNESLRMLKTKDKSDAVGRWPTSRVWARDGSQLRGGTPSPATRA